MIRAVMAVAKREKGAHGDAWSPRNDSTDGASCSERWSYTSPAFRKVCLKLGLRPTEAKEMSFNPFRTEAQSHGAPIQQYEPGKLPKLFRLFVFLYSRLIVCLSGFPLVEFWL